jgi:hypothetical protein
MVKVSPILRTLSIGAVGGLAGGVAEVGWIAFYGITTGTPTEPLARGIVESVIPQLATASWAVGLGILIHMGLAVAIGVGLALFLRLALRRAGAGSFEFGLVMLALAAVWGVNFLVALPRLNPAFTHLLPYSVTLLSKLLFGLSAAAVFRTSRMHPS